MKTLLFVGDSITDAGRKRELPLDLGTGYPAYVSARLGLEQPGAFTFYNRGISGNRIVDIYGRIKKDIIALKPDYMSILVGVNDVWHDFYEEPNGISTEKYKKIYTMLLEDLRQELPNTTIVLMEPFTLPGPANEDIYPQFRSLVEEKAQVVRELAEAFQLPFIPLQKDLDEMNKNAPEDFWLRDGVHPNIYFHQHIADKWMQLFKKQMGI